jgi:GST-like protein
MEQTDVIDLFFWPTGNGKKISIMLEEIGFEYRIIPVNINKGDQHQEDFRVISPNGKMPAIVDHNVAGGPIAVFESGAILTYLADKSGQLLPQEPRARFKVLQWLFWQIGGLGPMAGQAHYFLRYAPTKNEEGMERFRNEVARLYTVMDRHLAHQEFMADEYSIADIVCWPWVFRHDWQGQDLADFPNVKRWFDAVEARPAVQRGALVGKDLVDQSVQMSEEQKKLLFGLSDKHFRRKPG